MDEKPAIANHATGERDIRQVASRVLGRPALLKPTMPTPFGPLARHVVTDAGDIIEAVPSGIEVST